MRLVVFDDYHIGVLEGSSVHDVSTTLPYWRPNDIYGMNRLIAGWDSLRSAIEKAAKASPGKPLEQVRLRPPNPAPTHLFAAPGNYAAHRAEMEVRPAGGGGGAGSAEALGFFLKATGSISGPQDPIELPVKDYPDRLFEHEGEIAFVIGRPAKGVSPEEAASYIFGYTIVVDATLRVTETHHEERVQRKSFWSFSPMGPCITTADEIGDWSKLNVKLWLNGEQRQDAHASEMTVSIPKLLSRASHVLPLWPGDVYTTGSPPGVGRITPGTTW